MQSCMGPITLRAIHCCVTVAQAQQHLVWILSVIHPLSSRIQGALLIAYANRLTHAHGTVRCSKAQVEVDLDLNAHANARRWHGDRKARSAKQAKTLDAASRTLHIAEKTAQSQLSKARARMHDTTLPYHLPLFCVTR